jgi:predicted RNA-binding Zn-ribbon protein involved in translation (DUF1610 family)
MYRCKKCGHTAPEPGEHCNEEMEKLEEATRNVRVVYKCKQCGNESPEAGDCCGDPREKLCPCGSGKFASECCEKS